MSKTIHVSEDFHALVETHRRDDETMEEALRRLIGGPDLDVVAGVLSEESAETMRAAVDRGSERGVESSTETVDRFE